MNALERLLGSIKSAGTSVATGAHDVAQAVNLNTPWGQANQRAFNARQTMPMLPGRAIGQLNPNSGLDISSSPDIQGIQNPGYTPLQGGYGRVVQQPAIYSQTQPNQLNVNQYDLNALANLSNRANLRPTYNIPVPQKLNRL